MSFVFDFGFEGPLSSFEEAELALLFISSGEEADLGSAPGPIAVADASRFIEMFEMRSGLSPLEIGAYAEVIGGSDPIAAAVSRAVEARAKDIFPVIVGEDRRVTKQLSTGPLLALWGEIGRKETDDIAILSNCSALLAGVRASTLEAFRSMDKRVTVVTSRELVEKREVFVEALNRIGSPAHLSIDLDVLSPGVAETSRSLEPGGLSWYELMDVIEMVFQGLDVASVDLVGCKSVGPRSTAAAVSAQIVIQLAGLRAIGLKR